MSLPGTLRGRIVVAALAALLGTGIVAGALLLAGIERDGRSALDEELSKRAEQVLEPPEDRDGLGGPGGYGRGPGPPRGKPLLEGSGSFVQVFDGETLVATQGDLPESQPGAPGADGFSTAAVDGEDWRTLTVAGRGPADESLRFRFLADLQPVEDRVADVRRLVLVLGVVALLLLAGLTYGFTSVALRPLGRLRAGAARVSGTEDLAARPIQADEGPEEVRSLARALNEMLARLQASAESTQRALHATRRFAADAGHELRTPLTGLRANLETLERNPDLPRAQRAQVIAETIAEQDRMVRLLEGLQALARGEAADSLPQEDLDPGDLADAAVFGARRRHPRTTFELVDRAGPLRVRGWEGGLRLVVDNLLDNAARHGRRGGRVRVEVGRDADAAVIRVADDGPGVPVSEREALLEPFTRGADAHAPGSGLGLAIVAQQIALHGGVLRLGEALLGGLEVEVRLPLADDPASHPSAVATGA